MSSRKSRRIQPRKQATKDATKKPWYKRTAAKATAGLGAVAIGVATTILSGLAQKVLSLDSGSSSSTPSARPTNLTTARKSSLVSASATVVENPDQDIWVAEKPISLSREQSAKIYEIEQNGAHQGDLSDYLRSMQSLGAVKSTAIVIDLNLSTQLTDQVRVNRIRIDSQCRAPLTGTAFYSPPAGPATAIGKIGFDLDSPAPTAREMVGGGDSQSFGGDFFANKLQYLTKNDGNAYHIVIRTNKHYCEFRLKIDASANGAAQTVTIDDHGRPFQVSGLICDPAAQLVQCPKFSAYERVYAGGVAANPQGRDAWIPKDPKTYKGT